MDAKEIAQEVVDAHEATRVAAASFDGNGVLDGSDRRDKAIQALAAYLRTQEPLGDEHFRNMDRCRFLLPEPGPEVVGECLTEIRRLRAEVKRAQEYSALLERTGRFLPPANPDPIEEALFDQISDLKKFHQNVCDQYDATLADLRAQLQTAQQREKEAVESLSQLKRGVDAQSAVSNRLAWEVLDKLNSAIGIPDGSDHEDMIVSINAMQARISELEQQLQTATAALEAAREEGERLRQAVSCTAPRGRTKCPDITPDESRWCRSCKALVSHQRANGYWYTWDAPTDGGLPQSQIVKAKSVAEPQAEHPDRDKDLGGREQKENE